MNTTTSTQEKAHAVSIVAIFYEDMLRRRNEALTEAQAALAAGKPRKRVVEQLAKRFNFLYVWKSFAEEDRQIARADAAAQLDEFLAQQRAVAH